jgi:hypothetical protein
VTASAVLRLAYAGLSPDLYLQLGCGFDFVWLSSLHPDIRRCQVTLSTSEWAAQQWARVELGDRRLTRRAVAIGTQMAAHSEASLPEQMGAPSVLKAAYWLLNHPGVSLAALTAPHRQQTLQAARAVPVALLVEDTTELDFTAHTAKTGLGPIGDGRGRGLLLHSTLALEPASRMVLGLAHVQVVLRQPKAERRAKWVRTPEGRVWEVSAAQVGAPPAGVCWVHVSDSGSDIFAYMTVCHQLQKHFLIRAFRNRRLVWPDDSTEAADPTAQAVRDYVQRLEPHPGSEYTLTLPAEGQQPARQARVVLQWAALTLAPPVQAPPEIRAPGPLKVWVVRAWEPNPPPDVAPVEWVLLSSLPVETLDEAQMRMDWYTCRWFCEDLHQCLKTGCRIEQRQLDDGADIQRLLGFALPIAVRLLQLRQTVRQAPAVPATTVVEPLLVQVLARRQRLNWQTLTAEQFWQQVARLGGHQGRRHDGPPGWRTVWRGWRYLSDLADGARLFAHKFLSGCFECCN